MTSNARDSTAALRCLIDGLLVLLAAMLEAERHLPLPAAALAAADAPASARNRAHFLALRSFDLRALQERLAAQGLSSLVWFDAGRIGAVVRRATPRRAWRCLRPHPPGRAARDRRHLLRQRR